MDETGSPSALRIHRLRSEYLVGRDHPYPEWVRGELDGHVRRGLQDICAQALQWLCPAADESLWFIRRLDVELAVDASWDPEQFARPWSTEIGRSVQRVLNGGERSGEVIRFSNRAAFLARFVTDLAHGSAWDCWYYTSFDSLRGLAVDQAICEALVRDPSLTETALRRMSDEGNLENVLGKLSPAGAAQILRTVANQSSSIANTRSVVESLLNSPDSKLLRTGSPIDALRLCLNANRLGTGDSIADLAGALDRLLSIAEFVRNESSSSVVEALLQGDINEAFAASRRSATPDAVDALDRLRSMLGDDAKLMARTVALLRSSPTSPARLPGRADGGIETVCGGAFLLLRSLIDSGIASLIETAAHSESQVAEKLRWFVLLKCLGRDCALRNAGDSGLALAAGLKGSADALLDSADDMAIGLELGALVTTLVERERVGTDCWLAELVSDIPAGGRTLIVRDLASDEWLWASSVDSEVNAAARALVSAMDCLRTTCGLDPQFVFLDSTLSSVLHGENAACSTGERASSDAQSFTLWRGRRCEMTFEERERWAPHLARLIPGSADLDYLRLDPSNLFAGFSAEQDLFGSLAARVVLKDFARRLAGFDLSSCNFLRRNFLDAPGSIHVQLGADGFNETCARLQAPPLRLVLNIAGMDRQTFMVPWMEVEQVSVECCHF